MPKRDISSTEFAKKHINLSLEAPEVPMHNFLDKSFKQNSSELKALWAGPTNEYNGTSDSVTCTIDSHTGVVSNEVQWRAGTGKERTKVSWKQGNIVGDAEQVG